jgi:murein tripeptide amidase MpaA
MVDYLLDSLEIESMKRVFDFHFIPLVNIDAVKYGNSVSNLTGSLLNHNWKSPNKDYQAEIFYLKEYLQEINKESPISLILNLTT